LHRQNEVVFPETDIEEFSELQEVLTALIRNNSTVYQRQKEFSENASHELQTPLALLKSKIDLLLQDETLSEAQNEKISSLHLPLARVSRINKNLLLLAKIENQQFDDGQETELGALLNETIGLLTDQAENKGITLRSEMSAEVVVTGNKHLLEILVTNLLVNAIRHTTTAGNVSVELKDKMLKISNPGTKALQQEGLFQRFGRASAENPNSGLGLSIVKQICQRYGWRISYDFQNDLHIFSVRF
jgi:signal transduction histidine kinase